MADVGTLLDELAARWEDLRALSDRVDALCAADVLASGQTWSRRQQELWRMRAHIEVAMAALEKARREAGADG